jgi:hypothetical protein
VIEEAAAVLEVAVEVVSAEAGVADEVEDPVTAVVVVVGVVLPVVEASLVESIHIFRIRSTTQRLILPCLPRP